MALPTSHAELLEQATSGDIRSAEKCSELEQLAQQRQSKRLHFLNNREGRFSAVSRVKIALSERRQYIAHYY